MWWFTAMKNKDGELEIRCLCGDLYGSKYTLMSSKVCSGPFTFAYFTLILPLNILSTCSAT